MLFAGLDIGTSGCKVVVYDMDGNELFKSHRSYKEIGGNGRRELDSTVVVDKVFQLLEEMGRSKFNHIDALAIASLGESVICIDDNGNSLYPSMVTGDYRGAEETAELVRQMGADYVLQVTGLPPNELYSLPKLRWLKTNTNTIDSARMIFFYEDYIGYLLTGERRISYSSACRSLAFDIKKKQWSTELLAFAGIDIEKLSTPVEAGTVVGTILPELAKKLGLNKELRIVSGGHDQSCAALGSGLTDARCCEVSMGTCEFALMTLPSPTIDSKMIEGDFTCIPYVLPNMYLTSLEVTTSGILKNWARSVLFPNDVEDSSSGGFFNTIEKKLEGLRTNVLTLPQFGSSGNPDLSMNAVGTVTGLTVHTKSEEIYHSILEGISFQLLLAYEHVLSLGPKPEFIVATGGGAASDIVLQMRADIFNMLVYRPENEETGTLGCMLLAAKGVQAYSSLEEGIKRVIRYKKVFTPNQENVEYYKRKFKIYKKLYKQMHNFDSRSDI